MYIYIYIHVTCICICIYIHVYVCTYKNICVCVPESYFLYHLFAFWGVRNCTTFFENFSFTASTSKMKVRDCTNGE